MTCVVSVGLQLGNVFGCLTLRISQSNLSDLDSAFKLNFEVAIDLDYDLNTWLSLNLNLKIWNLNLEHMGAAAARDGILRQGRGASIADSASGAILLKFFDSGVDWKWWSEESFQCLILLEAFCGMKRAASKRRDDREDSQRQRCVKWDEGLYCPEPWNPFFWLWEWYKSTACVKSSVWQDFVLTSVVEERWCEF